MTTRGLSLSMPPTPCKRVTGLTISELECVVAVATCPPGMLATRQTISQIAGCGLNMPTLLVERGVLRRVDTVGRTAVYGVAKAWVISLGLAEARGDDRQAESA